MRGDGFCVFKPRGRKKYRIKFYAPVQGKRVHAGYRDKQATVAKARQLLKDHERSEAGLAVVLPNDRRKPLLGEEGAIQAYLADLERRRMSPATLRHRRAKLTRLTRATPWQSLADVRPEELTRFLATLPTPATANAYRDCLFAFLHWCVEQNWLVENPVARVRRSDPSGSQPHRRRAFTAGELLQLQGAAPKHADRYGVAALTGLRGNELSLVEVRDFDLTARVWVCRAEVDKTNRVWRLPLLPDVLPALERLCAGKAPQEKLFRKKLGNGTFDRHLKAAGIAKISPDGRRVNFHSLRYTFCTLLAKKMPIQNVQRLMRHSDIRRTVNLYLDLGLDDLAAAVEGLPPLLNKGGA
jgi:integrase